MKLTENWVDSMWVKICGVRDVETARRVAACGADAIGLNFFSQSPRRVATQTAAEIVRALSESNCEPVGLFVNHPLEEIHACCAACGIRTVQLHGEGSPEFIGELSQSLPGIRVIRAFRISESDLGPVEEFSQACRRLKSPLWAVLVDARSQAAFGGTGKTLDWPALAPKWAQVHEPRMILAGGLTPDNVAEAVSTVHPWGVDTASGVEKAPGEKDLELVGEFVRRARDETG